MVFYLGLTFQKHYTVISKRNNFDYFNIFFFLFHKMYRAYCTNTLQYIFFFNEFARICACIWISILRFMRKFYAKGSKKIWRVKALFPMWRYELSLPIRTLLKIKNTLEHPFTEKLIMQVIQKHATYLYFVVYRDFPAQRDQPKLKYFALCRTLPIGSKSNDNLSWFRLL